MHILEVLTRYAQDGRPTGSCAFSHCSNSGRIATESADVLFDPFEGKKLISEAIIANPFIPSGMVVPLEVIRGQEA
jgi:hypothetical protein